MSRGNGVGMLSRRGFLGLIERDGDAKHALEKLLMDRDGDRIWADRMVAEMGPACPHCQRTASPTVLRTYAGVRKALGASTELAEMLAAALEIARPAQVAMDEARQIGEADKATLAIQFLARRQGVPEDAMRMAVESVGSRAVVVDSRQEATNGPSAEENGKHES